jgi:hypothetical protein
MPEAPPVTIATFSSKPSQELLICHSSSPS